MLAFELTIITEVVSVKQYVQSQVTDIGTHFTVVYETGYTRTVLPTIGAFNTLIVVVRPNVGFKRVKVFRFCVANRAFIQRLSPP